VSAISFQNRASTSGELSKPFSLWQGFAICSRQGPTSGGKKPGFYAGLPTANGRRGSLRQALYGFYGETDHAASANGSNADRLPASRRFVFGAAPVVHSSLVNVFTHTTINWAGKMQPDSLNALEVTNHSTILPIAWGSSWVRWDRHFARWFETGRRRGGR